MLKPKFTYRDVRYSVDDTVFGRALKLFTDKKITNFTHDLAGYSATVIGTQPYKVYVSQRAVDYGMCNCYMGQNDTLCKHMIAVGLEALHKTGKISKEGKPREDPPTNLNERKALLSAGLRKIKSYEGPSRIWFAYQNKLDIGAAMIREAMQGLQPSTDNAKFLWDIVKRVDRKLTNGVDDSNGTVWPVASEAVTLLAKWSRDNSDLQILATKFCQTKTNFDFANELAQKLSNKASDR